MPPALLGMVKIPMDFLEFQFILAALGGPGRAYRNPNNHENLSAISATTA